MSPDLLPGIVRDNLLGQLFAGLFLILVLSGVTFGFFFVGLEGQLDDQVDTQVRETSNLQSDIYAAWFQSREADMAEVVSSLRARSGDDDPATVDADLQSETLSDSLVTHGTFTAFHLVDPETGEVVASSNESVRGRSFDPDRFRASEFVTDAYVSVTGDRVMAIGDPLGTRMGVILVGEINATAGGPEIRQTIEGSSTVVVTTDGEPVLGGETLDPELLVEAEQQLVEEDGSLVAVERLDNNLFVVTRSPRSEAFALQERILQSFLVTLAITFGVLSIVIGLGGRGVLKSLTRLARRAREVEAGDLSVEFSTSRSDEIGDLYGSFDAMRSTLREQLEESQQARAQAEQLNEQLQVIGRVLRHNLRNDLNTMRIYAGRIETGDSESVERDARRIQEQSESLLQKADKQRALTEVLSEDVEPQPHDVELWLDRKVAEIRAEYPGAEIDLAIDEPPHVLALPKLEVAVEELLVNAIVHSDQQTPQIEIESRVEEDTVAFVISDDGPTIPEIERGVLAEEEIGQLNHGSGIGLWLVYWVVHKSGGELLFEDDGPRGNTVVLKLPRAPGDDGE